MNVLFKREDGTFVITHPATDQPYHVLHEDPLYTEYEEEAALANFEPPLPPPPPPPVPQTISDRQFFQQLALMGTITQEDALAAVTVGFIPSTLSAFLNNIPPEDAFTAQMILCGATQFERNHPLTIAIGTSQGLTPEQVDDFFRAAAQL